MLIAEHAGQEPLDTVAQPSLKQAGFYGRAKSTNIRILLLA